MATISKSHRYLGGDHHLLTPPSYTDHFEFDESDLWTDKTESNKKPVSNPRSIRKPVRKSLNVDPVNEGPRSLPMNIPDWSKILRSEYRPRASVFGDEFKDDDDNDDDEDVNDRMPPHEYLARKRVASFSVHEGVGRTLKGRDLSRVRNAIWKQTGFED